MKDRGNSLSTQESNKRLLELIYKYELIQDCKNIVWRKKILIFVNKITWKKKPTITFQWTFDSLYLFIKIDKFFITRYSFVTILEEYCE